MLFQVVIPKLSGEKRWGQHQKYNLLNRKVAWQLNSDEVKNSEKQWGHHQNYNVLNRKVVWPRNQGCRQMRKNKAWRQLKHGVKKLGQHQQYNLSPFVRTSLYFHLSCRTNFLLLWPKEIYSMISKWRAKWQCQGKTFNFFINFIWMINLTLLSRTNSTNVSGWKWFQG